MARDVEDQNMVYRPPSAQEEQLQHIQDVPASVELLPTELSSGQDEQISGDVSMSSSIGEGLHPANISDLRPDQYRAFDVVRSQIIQWASGQDDIPPLRMIIYGEGGTGKSKVIQTITREFERRGLR